MDREITKDNLENAESNIGEVYKENEVLLSKILNKYQLNVDSNVVALKIGLINTLYSTHLNTDQNAVSVTELAEYIACPKLEFDKRVKEGESSLGDDILKHFDRNIFSFVSKYLTLHSYHVYGKDDFAIYDRLVQKQLAQYTDKTAYYINKNFRQEKNYSAYVQFIHNTIEKHNLDSVKFAKRKLDWYLWQAGKSATEKNKEKNKE